PIGTRPDWERIHLAGVEDVVDPTEKGDTVGEGLLCPKVEKDVGITDPLFSRALQRIEVALAHPLSTGGDGGTEIGPIGGGEGDAVGRPTIEGAVVDEVSRVGVGVSEIQAKLSCDAESHQCLHTARNRPTDV